MLNANTAINPVGHHYFMSNDFDDKRYCTTILAPLILNRQKGNKVVVKQNACLMCVDRENLADEGGSDTGSNA